MDVLSPSKTGMIWKLVILLGFARVTKSKSQCGARIGMPRVCYTKIMGSWHDFTAKSEGCHGCSKPLFMQEWTISTNDCQINLIVTGYSTKVQGFQTQYMTLTGPSSQPTKNRRLDHPSIHPQTTTFEHFKMKMFIQCINLMYSDEPIQG